MRPREPVLEAAPATDQNQRWHLATPKRDWWSCRASPASGFISAAKWILTIFSSSERIRRRLMTGQRDIDRPTMNASFRWRLVRQGVAGRTAERSTRDRVNCVFWCVTKARMKSARSVGRSDYARARRSRHLMDHDAKRRHARVQFICCPTKTINSLPPILLPREAVVESGQVRAEMDAIRWA